MTWTMGSWWLGDGVLVMKISLIIPIILGAVALNLVTMVVFIVVLAL